MHVLQTRGNLTIERAGVNFVREIVEEAGCLFKEINLQHDFGQDATIILVVDGEVQPREVALQIKSGRKYNRARYCRIPVTPAHMSFWAHHDLLTLGLVYDPTEKAAYWLDLKAEARAHERAGQMPASITFRKSLWNRFDSRLFRSTLIPVLMKKAPVIPLDEAITWSLDDDFDTHMIGVRVLLNRYFVEKMTWETLIRLFNTREVSDMSPMVPAAFSKLLGNWDLSYTFTTARLSPEVQEFARNAVTSLGPEGVAKLLEFLDCDEGWDFSRGSLGRAFLIIFESQKDMREIFRTIVTSSAFGEPVRRMATELDLAYSKDPRWYWE